MPETDTKLELSNLVIRTGELRVEVNSIIDKELDPIGLEQYKKVINDVKDGKYESERLGPHNNNIKQIYGRLEKLLPDIESGDRVAARQALDISKIALYYLDPLSS